MANHDEPANPPRVLLAKTSSGVHTFLIADIRGYARFTHERGDEAGAELAATFASLAREIVSQYGGKVTEIRGDEALAVFSSPRGALRAANDLQLRLAQHSEQNSAAPLEVGIGLDAGEAMAVEDGFRGGALNVASRLCAMARGGEVFASESVVHLARRVEGLDYVDRGPIELKGLAGRVRVFQIGPEGALPATLPALESNQTPTDELYIATLVVGLTGAACGVLGTVGAILFSSLSRGDVIGLFTAFGSCLVAFWGASRARERSRGATLLFILAALGISVSIGWFALVAAPLLLTAAGLAQFVGNRQESP